MRHGRQPSVEESIESLRQVAGPVSRETFESLIAFHDMFRQWASRINLAAPSTHAASWRRHILDSAQLVGIDPIARHWLDLGSGAGFPGLVVAILTAKKVSSHNDLIESNRKKAAFLKSAAARFDLPVRVHAGRIEEAALDISPEVVTARALAPLPNLLHLAAPWLENGAKALFHKGREYRPEVEESAKRWRFDLVEHPSQTDPHGIILEVRGLERRS
jgi:16S rRNA (guanine527-N7)-methyltransferase